MRDFGTRIDRASVCLYGRSQVHPRRSAAVVADHRSLAHARDRRITRDDRFGQSEILEREIGQLVVIFIIIRRFGGEGEDMGNAALIIPPHPRPQDVKRLEGPKLPRFTFVDSIYQLGHTQVIVIALISDQGVQVP